VWTLADDVKRGYLRQTEFNVAMRLIALGQQGHRLTTENLKQFSGLTAFAIIRNCLHSMQYYHFQYSKMLRCHPCLMSLPQVLHYCIMIAHIPAAAVSAPKSTADRFSAIESLMGLEDTASQPQAPAPTTQPAASQAAVPATHQQQQHQQHQQQQPPQQIPVSQPGGFAPSSGFGGGFQGFSGQGFPPQQSAGFPAQTFPGGFGSAPGMPAPDTSNIPWIITPDEKAKYDGVFVRFAGNESHMSGTT